MAQSKGFGGLIKKAVPKPEKKSLPAHKAGIGPSAGFIAKFAKGKK